MASATNILNRRENTHRLTTNSNFHFFLRSSESSLPPSPPSFLISLGSPWHSHLRCSLPETWGIGWGDGGSPRASNSGISSRSNGVSAPPDSPSRGYKARFFFFFFFLNLLNQLVHRRRQYFDGNKKKWPQHAWTGSLEEEDISRGERKSSKMRKERVD